MGVLSLPPMGGYLWCLALGEKLCTALAMIKKGLKED